VARDKLGIKPLYYAVGEECIWFASEFKALTHLSVEVKSFPPGGCWVQDQGFLAMKRELPEEPKEDPKEGLNDCANDLEQVLNRAVRQRVSKDTGVLLSGGLDSSLIAALAAISKPSIPTFVAGMTNSPDLKAAQQVANSIGAEHHQIVFSMEDVDRVLPEVIYALESFDAPLVRGAMVNYFASRLARDHVGEVLCGEGADELFAGYSYLRELSTSDCLEKELKALQSEMHNTGLQRVDRINAHHGLQPRMPFLDEKVVQAAQACPVEHKLTSEGDHKALLREVAKDLIPNRIACRPKEKFAQGSGLARAMSDRYSAMVSDREFSRHNQFPGGDPLASPEELYYYRVFCEFFDPEQVSSCIGRTRGLPTELNN